MDNDTLRDHLTRLHQELGNAPRVEPQSRQLLVDIMHDITRLTASETPPDAGPAGPSTAAGGASGLPERLENSAVQFEADHPGIAASIRRFVDLLGKAGL